MSDKPKRRWFRFSLRTLILAILLIGSGATLWHHWEPWVLERTLYGHTDEVCSASFSPDGNHILTKGDDRTARLWETDTGAIRYVFQTDTRTEITRSSFSPDGSCLVTPAEDNTAIVWDVATGTKRYTFPVDNFGVESAGFSPDGRHIFTTGDSLIVWNAENGAQLWKHDKDSNHVELVRYFPDSRFILVLFYNSNDKFCCHILDASNGELRTAIELHFRSVISADITPNGQTIAFSNYDDYCAFLFDAKTGLQRSVLKTEDGATVSSVEFSSNGQRLITSGDTPRIWNVATGTELFRLVGHEGSASTAFFSPDERTIVTSSPDSTARIWDAQDGRQLSVLKGHTADVEYAGFSLDGRRIVTGSKDKTAKVWVRQRPERWWGIAWLPEFWLTVIFCCAFAWSLGGVEPRRRERWKADEQ